MSEQAGLPQDEGTGMKSLNADARETTSEEAYLVERKRRLSLNTGQRLRYAVLVVSGLSVAVLLYLGCNTLALSVRQGSSAAFAFSLDAFLDCLSSIVVIWRFWGSAATLYSNKKEKIACIILGSLFIVSAFAITTKAAISLANHDIPEDNFYLYIICIVNAVFCGIVMIAKLYLAVKLESWSIGTDAVNSGIGFVLATATLIGGTLFNNNSKIWYFDPVIGIVCSFVLVMYGIWIIVYETLIANHSEEPKEGE